MSDDFESGPEVGTPPAESAAVPQAPVEPSVPSNDVDMDAEVHKLDPNESDEAAAERERDRSGRFRRRAKSQHASPEDVPRIRELTKKLRTMEQELQALKAPKASDTTQAEPSRVTPFPAPPAAVSGDPAPTIEQFAHQDDPYGAWLRATMKWELKQEQRQAEAAKQQQDFQAATAQVYEDHRKRLTALVAKNPAAAQVLQSVTLQPPPVLDRAIMLDPNSADVALYLASHPDVLEELVLLTTAQPVTRQTVEITQRRLHKLMTAATSGSVASAPAFTPAPRPPNPLRTGPMKTGTGVPDPDDDSEAGLEAHARQYGYGYSGRRRRA